MGASLCRHGRLRDQGLPQTTWCCCCIGCAVQRRQDIREESVLPGVDLFDCLPGEIAVGGGSETGDVDRKHPLQLVVQPSFPLVGPFVRGSSYRQHGLTDIHPCQLTKRAAGKLPNAKTLLLLAFASQTMIVAGGSLVAVSSTRVSFLAYAEPGLLKGFSRRSKG